MLPSSDIKAVRKQKERSKELEGIDLSNIVSSSRRRSTSSFVPPPKPKISSESDDEGEDDHEDTEDEDDGNEDDNADETDDEGPDDSNSEASNEGKSIRICCMVLSFNSLCCCSPGVMIGSVSCFLCGLFSCYYGPIFI